MILRTDLILSKSKSMSDSPMSKNNRHIRENGCIAIKGVQKWKSLFVRQHKSFCLFDGKNGIQLCT
jgi:hypothetical protein